MATGPPSGVRGQGVKRKWLQEDVDACTHLTEQHYIHEPYENFSPVELQRVWQKNNGSPKDATPQTSNQMAVTQATILSEILSKFSGITEIQNSLSCRLDSMDDGRTCSYDVNSCRIHDNCNCGIDTGGTPGRGTRGSSRSSLSSYWLGKSL